MSDVDRPLISVIVPIFNVEKYVKKCLDSLCHQTMKQIEVICIDDGSTDNSGRIADKYATNLNETDERWPQFRVIHMKNNGLSAARNRGIDEAKADWIIFVDSDDWVEPELCEITYRIAKEYDCSVVIYSFDFWKNGKKKRKHKQEIPKGMIDKATAHRYGGIEAWNKLYRYELFESIRYPEGRVYEDLATTHKLIQDAKNIYLIHNCLYHHVYRKGSITDNYKDTYFRDGFISAIERYDFLLSKGYVEDISESSTLCAHAIDYLSVTEPGKDDLYYLAKDIVNAVTHIPRSFSRKKKIALIAWKSDKRLFYLFCRIRKVFNR